MEYVGYVLNVFTLHNLLWLTIGSFVGAFLGALPGMSADTGIAMFLPLTFGLDPTAGLIVLCAIYTSGSYGGNITGVLLNTPGTPEAMFMAMDGFPMTCRGLGAKAIGITTYCAFTGGLIGSLTLLFLSPFVANIALQFGPLEMFLTSTLGIVIIIGITKGAMEKGILSACFGLLVATIGTDAYSGLPRFNFGIMQLLDGVPLLPTVLGIAAITELLIMGAEISQHEDTLSKAKGEMKGSPFLKWKDYMHVAKTTIRSAIIGTIVGIIPAASTGVAIGISYNIAKKEAPDPETFGQYPGNERGLATTSAAHAAITGGSLVPLVTLGIPGSATAALFIGGLAVHGLAPGIQLFTVHKDIIYTVMIALVVSNAYILLVGLFGCRFFVKVTNIPIPILIPIVGVFSVLGAYVFRYLNFDMFLALLFGLVGYYMRNTGIPLVPFILAYVLGRNVETHFRRTVALFHNGVVYNGLSIALLLCNLFFIVWPFTDDIKRLIKKMINRDKSSAAV